MLESTETQPIAAAEETTAAMNKNNEDTRAPVGMDAGAPQVTAAEVDEGGWHGGAEENAREGLEEKEEKGEAQPERAPLGAKVDVPPELELDEEAKRLAREAMKAVEGEGI